ncbi:MAG: hypothetical protein U0V70_10575 [Terriglobia bacterium]
MKNSIPDRSRMRSNAKILTALSVLLLGCYLISGIRYATYHPHRSANYLWGAYHVHSTMSDGLHSAEEIARQAQIAGVNLVLLTDHGAPNLSSTVYRRVIGDVIIAGGSEVQLAEGRLTFFGARGIPQLRLSSLPPEAIHDISGRGGFPILAYPEDPEFGWKYWESDLSPSGIEILNLFTTLRCSSLWDKLGLALYYPFSRYYFMKLISFSPGSMERWDGFLQTRKTWGLLATDAHGGFRIGRWLKAELPSYADAFSFVGLGIDKRYVSNPEAAVRKGDFFNCLRGAGEPERFDFFAVYGRNIYNPGSNTPLHSNLKVEVQDRNQRVWLVLKKNGAKILETVGNHLELLEAEYGVYRVEVFLEDHPLLPADVPWIVSNPIFVGSKRNELFSSMAARRSRRFKGKLVSGMIPPQG